MVDKKKNVEKFKVTAIYTDGFFGNDIDIVTSDNQKYQIAVDKKIELSEDLIGKYIELKYTKGDGRYYFDYIDYNIG